MMKSVTVIVVLLLAVGLAAGEIRNKGWWKHAVFYQVYPRSFMDSDGDGIGDLEGIRRKIQHFNESGVTAIWLSPIYRSPMKDFGYDISDFKDIDKIFGNLDDLKNLCKNATASGLKVILDLVPNHTSDQHYWFQMSVNRIGKYENYYVWSDGKKNASGHLIPPNNWVSVFNGSAWTYHEGRKQYYFHQFLPEQPDLNYSNPYVQQEMKDVIRYWLDLGIDGFRIDAVPHLFESNITQDEPVLKVPGGRPLDHVSYNHTLTKDQPETYKLVQSWKQFVDEYAEQHNQDEKVLLTEAYTSLENTVKYYKYGADVPFNFKFITDANSTSTALDFKNLIGNWTKLTPPNNVSNWVMGNHDRTRIATRYRGRADQMVMLEMILPGVAVTYYGEEINMEDNDTLHVNDFRDGCRTPFQWDNSTSAGFSKNSTTWLPVHNLYKEVNLAKQKNDSDSHYKLYTALTKMRRESDVLKYGSLETIAVNKDVLAVIRQNDDQVVLLLLNLARNTSVVNLSNLVNHNMQVKLSSVGSGLNKNPGAIKKSITLPVNASVVLVSGASLASYSVATLLMLLVVSLFRS